MELHNDFYTNDQIKNSFYTDRSLASKSEFSTAFPTTHFAPRKDTGNLIHLQIFIDKSSVELFADGGSVVMTDLFFPTEDFSLIRSYSNNGNAPIVETGRKLLNPDVHEWLLRADRDFVRARFKEVPDRFGFNGIADRRRCGMRVNVIHLCRRYLGVCKGQLHGVGHFQTIFPGNHHMIGFTGGIIAGNFETSPCHGLSG